MSDKDSLELKKFCELMLWCSLGSLPESNKMFKVPALRQVYDSVRLPEENGVSGSLARSSVARNETLRENGPIVMNDDRQKTEGYGIESTN